MTTGEKLRMLRGKNSQSVTAAGIGITKSSLSMYEMDQRNPSDKAKVKIARYFGKTVGELFFDEVAHSE